MVTLKSHRKIPQLRFLELTSSNFILSCLLVLLCIVSTSLAQNETVTREPLPPANEVQYCEKKRVRVEIPYEGCNSTSLLLPTCIGMCGSHTKITSTAPYSQLICQCCTSSRHRIRIRRLDFDCNGVFELKKVYLPRVEKCSCIGCGSTLAIGI